MPRIALMTARDKMSSTLTDDHYFQIIHKKALDLLISPNAVPVSDQRRLLLFDDFRNMIKGNPLSFSWPDAILTKAIAVLDYDMPDPRNLDALQRYYNRFLTAEGSIKKPISNLDIALHGEALLYLAIRTGEPRYHSAANQLIKYLLDRAKSEGLSLAYRPKYINNIRLVDSLGMISPFLAMYGTIYNNEDAKQLAVSQVREFIRFGIEHRSGLPFHGYNPDKNYSPIGIVGWGRLTGWYALGLIDTLRQLPRASIERKELETAAFILAQNIRFYQNKDGGWNSIINVPSHFDSSATAMLTYFLCRAYLEGIIDASYKYSINLGVAALKRHTRIDGTVDFAQGDIMDINRASTYYGPAPYAQGMALAAIFLATRISSD